jgi:hypothetical protein
MSDHNNDADSGTTNVHDRIPEAYDTTPEVVVRGRQRIADPDVPLGFIVDASQHAVAPSYAPALG